MGLKESRIAPAHEYLVHDHKTEFNGHHLIDKSPPSSIDGISLDEGVESKGSIDEPTNLGVSPSASSDGHTDSAFGESIVSSSSVSTPVGGHSSNRFNPTLRTTASHEEETGNDLVSQQSSSSNLLESAPVVCAGSS
ncbi:hypothetical protein OS493_032681 [Desmophyllum pertusum]|uniref:Uncharacterized protein n=1 Tax=Desmophyllum pertusum TaxID=174260 RepID=A0A9W9ZY78_9CNID|nr:hypothetical protein OS493_032681 [Desmophyllum pertusum]